MTWENNTKKHEIRGQDPPLWEENNQDSLNSKELSNPSKDSQRTFPKRNDLLKLLATLYPIS